jgi:hypothetical protein
MALFAVTGTYSFWLYFQWTGIGGEPGADLDVVRRNAYASLFAGFICFAGVVALTIAHIRKSRRDI